MVRQKTATDRMEAFQSVMATRAIYTGNMPVSLCLSNCSTILRT